MKKLLSHTYDKTPSFLLKKTKTHKANKMTNDIRLARLAFNRMGKYRAKGSSFCSPFFRALKNVLRDEEFVLKISA